MKRLSLAVILLSVSFAAASQTPVKLEFDLEMHATVVNDEYDASDAVLATSGTLPAVRMAPYLSLVFGEGSRISTGVNLCRDFGTPGVAPSAEWAVWYQLNRPVFTLAAGVFPCSLLKGEYSTLILSDSRRFYDALLDGFLLQWNKGRSHYEIALDWNGKFDRSRREQFNVITSGKGCVNSWISLNWEGMFHHYADSEEVWGVVDDHVLHPYMELDFAAFLPLQKLAVEAGPVLGYHFDRRKEDRRTSLGGLLSAEVRKWNVGIRNEAYYGGSQAPFYKSADANGSIYGSDLYMRASLWQVTPESAPGFYDRAVIYWQPKVTQGVHLKLLVAAHFGYGGFLGSQQIVEAIIDLHQLCLRWNKKH